MYRLVALLLALLLPLQFAWGAAASYCQHETSGAAVQHLGHHEHVHQAETKQPVSSKLVVDNDCASCHATCSAVASELAANAELPTGVGALPVPPSEAHTSALARAPDRPQWLRLA